MARIVIADELLHPLPFYDADVLWSVEKLKEHLSKDNPNDEIRRDIEKLKSELWYQHFNSPTAGKTASYSTEDIKYIRYCRDVLNTSYELPSWRNRVWTPGSNKNSYSGQKRNKIFSGTICSNNCSYCK